MTEAFTVRYATYQRPFRSPLQTAYGPWAVRCGAIVTLRSPTGTVCQGEIAPLEWFGTESLDAAVDFCRSLNGAITTAQIAQIPERLPCCQFAFESALARLTDDRFAPSAAPNPNIAALLPTGIAALNAWQPYYQAGHRTFKWKIGVNDMATEMAWFQRLYGQLPIDCQLRLDANASLSVAASEQWLDYLSHYQIEYLEQPLAIDQFAAMQRLSVQYATLIALDESIANLQQIQDCYHQGWRGVYVIKPAIVGSPQRLRQWLQQHPIDKVFSSVFETPVGYDAGLKFAQQVGSDRALGYGTMGWRR
jgi:o-succinylbenzoate synthase